MTYNQNIPVSNKVNQNYNCTQPSEMIRIQTKLLNLNSDPSYLPCLQSRMEYCLQKVISTNQLQGYGFQKGLYMHALNPLKYQQIEKFKLANPYYTQDQKEENQKKVHVKKLNHILLRLQRDLKYLFKAGLNFQYEKIQNQGKTTQSIIRCLHDLHVQVSLQFEIVCLDYNLI
ncbi:hypothetical protein ABPG74_012995 [Tetrahymena malaccensis]